ncbi:hypothetical protein O9G_005115 [Rozella allomycis CSF55]|uniref:Uncharacterized protein n=1 Tax=Rozella allomycis (strain CSF55) TaxID=988480 RepID=A0A075AZI0_ROZAC|nr:hypothetical protein O9G_005115 [Rozella allomycis CSF55]|eukprot:EPZ33994.1 hypothetical protein O9G_005115 [Rozella allomycis CSF55]
MKNFAFFFFTVVIGFVVAGNSFQDDLKSAISANSVEPVRKWLQMDWVEVNAAGLEAVAAALKSNNVNLANEIYSLNPWAMVLPSPDGGLIAQLEIKRFKDFFEKVMKYIPDDELGTTLMSVNIDYVLHEYEYELSESEDSEGLENLFKDKVDTLYRRIFASLLNSDFVKVVNLREKVEYLISKFSFKVDKHDVINAWIDRRVEMKTFLESKLTQKLTEKDTITYQKLFLMKGPTFSFSQFYYEIGKEAFETHLLERFARDARLRIFASFVHESDNFKPVNFIKCSSDNKAVHEFPHLDAYYPENSPFLFLTIRGSKTEYLKVTDENKKIELKKTDLLNDAVFADREAKLDLGIAPSIFIVNKYDSQQRIIEATFDGNDSYEFHIVHDGGLAPSA